MAVRATGRADAAEAGFSRLTVGALHGVLTMQGNSLVQGNTLVRRIVLMSLAGVLAAFVWASPAPGQQAAVETGTGAGSTAPPLQRRALAAMEALREEIATLVALRDAQAALLAWSRENARGGALPQALPAALCKDPALGRWCALAAGDLRHSICGGRG